MSIKKTLFSLTQNKPNLSGPKKIKLTEKLAIATAGLEAILVQLKKQ